MNFDLFLYATSIVFTALALLVAGFTYLYHRREFWKIKDRDKAVKARQHYDAIAEDVAIKKNELKNIDGQLNAKNDSLASAEDKIRRADQAQAFLSQQTENIAKSEALKKELVVLESKYAGASTDLEAARARLGGLNSQLAELEAKKVRLEAELTERNEAAAKRLAEKTAEVEKQVEEARNLLGQLLETQKKLAGEINSLEKQKADLEMSVKTIGDAVNELNIRKAAIEKEIENLKPTYDEYLKAKGEIEGLKHEINGLEKNRAGLKETLELIKKMAEDAGPPKPDVKYADLWKPLELPDLKPAATPAQERVAFDSMKQYVTGVNGLGLKFPDRVLLAFHTALKTQLISPITVLAGISGTGKSLLPKAYAEGMGIHFVSLPVQPRWDSPQDLFGFYNYLEKRYKATDLARAMVQFEKHYLKEWPLPEDWDPNNSKQDRMLLVLLDEMNLARIEYYFSDFLSKLETRREIDSKVDKERVKAAIALDVGTMSKEETPIRMYPDTNVLFAGTMNEDETTQTLSDKVLDRSCVMRFGKPKQAGRYRVQNRAAPIKTGLTHDAWKDWCKTPDTLGGQLDTVNGWINDLNNAMNEMGRPFGHRVILAIQTYAANYPSWAGGNERLHHAMADQIEQRIMPKLRGLDIEQHQASLNKIRDVIQQFSDNPLLSAFDEGQRDKMIFSWQGLDRSED